MGPIITGVDGLTLTQEEMEVIVHPLVGGVILFSRNYEEPAQLSQLCNEIKAHNPKLTISVDHEGGRVQRFLNGFTHIPAMTDCVKHLENINDMSLIGWLLAAELRASNVDFSYSPVLDINGISKVIGNRAFARSPQAVIAAAKPFIEGLRSAGMANVTKHFPGHGSVGPDSHIAMPVDERPFTEIEQHDMQPFIELAQLGLIDGVMPAHVIYSEVDSMPACFSKVWLQKILKTHLNFKGAVISDDMGMQGAVQVGDYVTRVSHALDAGCDSVLLCNEKTGLYNVLDGLSINQYQSHGVNMHTYLQHQKVTFSQLRTDSRYHQAKALIDRIHEKVNNES